MALHPLTWRVDRFSGGREGRNATSKAGDVSQAAAVSDSRASLRMGMEHYPGTGPLARMKPLHLLNELHNGAQKPVRQGDRKSVVQGKSVSVRVDLGGRSTIKKTNNTTKPTPNQQPPTK